MKLIGVSNFDKESVSDILVAENVNDYYSPLILTLLNSSEEEYFFKVVDDEYPLYIYDPNR